MTRYDIYTADECFLTGTAAEVIAAIELDTRPISNGKPGPFTARVIARFREIASSTGAEVLQVRGLFRRLPMIRLPT